MVRVMMGDEAYDLEEGDAFALYFTITLPDAQADPAYLRAKSRLRSRGTALDHAGIGYRVGSPAGPSSPEPPGDHVPGDAGVERVCLIAA